MKHFVVIAAVFFFNICYVTAQQVAANGKRKTAEKNILAGNIKDKETDNALQGATIYLPDLKTGAVSDAQGNFTIRDIQSGRHLLEISYVGYATLTVYVYIKGTVEKKFTLGKTVVENSEVVVTGTNAATQSRKITAPVTVVKQKELLAGVATNLIDALSKKPGVSQLSTGPAISKPVIRGLGYNRIVVVNDGVRQEGQQWGDEHGIEIDEYSTNKIEILKGPGSLMYGSDAMAGVINILSNVTVPQNTIRGNIISNYQHNNKLRGVGANIAANKGGLDWSVFASYKAAADYKNKYDGYVFNSKFNEKNVGGHVGVHGNWGYAHLLVSSFNQKPGLIEGNRNNEGKFIKAMPGGAETAATKNDFNSINAYIPYQHIRHFKVTSDNSFNIANARLALTVAYQQNRRQEYGAVDAPTTPALYFDLRTLNYNLAYQLAQKNGWLATIGINGMKQLNKNRGEEVLIPEYDLLDAGIYLFMQKIFNKTTFSGGARFDYRTLNADFFANGNVVKFNAFTKKFSNLAASAGVSYQATEQLTFKLNAARGFRAPGMPELAANGTHEGTNRYEYGNKNLQSETSFQLDAGTEFASKHVLFTVNAFYNSINNFIYYKKLLAANGTDSTVEVDGELIAAFAFAQQNANLYGAEFFIDVHPHPVDWLHIENTFSFVNAQFKTAVEGVKYIPNIPAARWIGGIKTDFLPAGKTIKNTSFTFEVAHTFKQARAFTAFATETPTAAYTLLNTGISTDVAAKNKTLFSIYFNALNITDVAYQNHLSRLKYAAQNLATGRNGIFNVGRNFSIKINVPLNFSW
jgi:iron complex outermembrane recepter protein